MSFLVTVIMILGDIFLPPPGIPLFTILYFGWKYIKLKVKADVYLTYLLFFGIPQVVLFFIIKLIALPFKEGFGVLKWLENKLELLENGLEYVEHNLKKSVLGAVFFLILGFPIISPLISGIIPDGGIMAFNLQSAAITVFLILASAFFPVVLIATIVDLVKGGLGSGKSKSDSRLDSMYTSPGGGPGDAYKEMTEAMDNRRETAEAMEKGANKVTKAASKAEGSGLFSRIAAWFKGCVPSNVASVGRKLLKLNPMSKAGKKAAKKASKNAAAKQVASTAARVGEGAKGVSLLPLIPFALALLLLQVGIIFLIFGFVVELYLPYVMGPLAGAAGFTTDYATYGGQVLEPYIPNIDLEPVVLMVQGPLAKAQCFFEGPQCFSEWQMNNTQRPGSEEAGQEYDLTANGFEIEQGQTIDAAYQRPSRPLSVAFALENPRYGLKGISARDVQYRVLVRDNQGGELCGTEFLPISFYQDSSIDSTTIPPGDSYAVGVGTNERNLEESLNLFECRLLQPGQAKLTRTAELAFMYDYSSQSNLRIRAMSYENFADRDLDRGYKKSETADTPVKSYVNVYAPVLFDETEDGDRNARPFEVQIGLQTDDPNIRYRVDPESIRFTPSRSTEIVGGSCEDFEEASTGPGGVETYRLDDPGVTQIERETTDVGRWYTTARSPSVMECTMKIASPEDISSSGETLILDVSANYTVIKDGVTDDFQTWNTLCSGHNCPFLVPEQTLNGQSERIQNNFISTCDPALRATAVGGCDVREPGIDYDTDIQDAEDLDEDAWVNGLGGNDVINYEKVNEGETAYDWNYFVQESAPESMRSHSYLSGTGGKPVIGLDEEEWTEITPDRDAPARALYITGAGEPDTRFRELSDQRAVCADLHGGSTENAVSEFAQIWGDRYSSEKVLYLKPASVKSSCEPNQGAIESFIDGVFGQNAQQRYDEAKQGCDGVLTLFRSASYACYS